MIQTARASRRIAAAVEAAAAAIKVAASFCAIDDVVCTKNSIASVRNRRKNQRHHDARATPLNRVRALNAQIMVKLAVRNANLRIAMIREATMIADQALSTFFVARLQTARADR